MPRLTVIMALAVVAWGMAAWAQQERCDRIMVVPAPRDRGVVIDGDLKEWDMSAAIDTALDEKLRPRFSMQFAVMYDAEALYIGAHVVDDTPMMNRTDPRISAGFGADALQIHLCSDVAQPHPLPANSDAPTLCDLALWYYTDKQEPALFIGWGRDNEKQIPHTYTGKDSGVAFKKDSDGKGYTLEARIPWARLNAPRPPKAGEKIAFTIQPFWSDATGERFASYFNDIITHPGWAYTDCSMWGCAEFLEKGNLPVTAKQKAVEKQLPVTTTLILPDRKAATVSVALYNSSNVMVRTLLAGASTQPESVPLYGARIAKRSGATVDVAWDGCDDLGKPLPAGTYDAKVLTSRGIGQKWIASLHNAGNPPWNTDDGAGSWGGDHAPPISVATDAERVYLLWAGAECGPAIIACRPDGQKIWGAKSVSFDAGWGFYALAADGKYVYLLQDGYLYGLSGKAGEVRTNYPAIIRFDAKTGKPVNFPFGKRNLFVGKWPDSLMQPGFVYKDMAVFNSDNGTLYNDNSRYKRPWEKIKNNDYGPQEMARNTLGLAVCGDTAYVTKYLENKAASFEMSTGNPLKEWALPRPVGIAVAADGTVYAASGKGIVKLLPDGSTAPVVKDALSAPWGLAVGKDGLLYVSDCGDQMQVKVFDTAGSTLRQGSVQAGSPQAGRLVRTIGKKGGRAWIGKYDQNGMLEPAGLALDRDNKLWVCEYDLSPYRISTWQQDGTSTGLSAGKFLKEFFGPSTYSVYSSVDDARPELVLVHNTWFDVNYKTGAVKPVGTFQRSVKGPQFRAWTFRYEFRHVNGRTYACSQDAHGSVVLLVNDVDGVPVGEPVAAWGMLRLISFNDLWPEDLPAKAREQYWPIRDKVMYQWHDLNGNRLIDDNEWIFTPADQSKVKTMLGLYWINGVDDALTYWTSVQFPATDAPAVALRVKEWRGGAPVYESFAEIEPVFRMGKAPVYTTTPDNESLCLTRETGLEKRRLNGDVVWSYPRSYQGLNTPLAAPGDIISGGFRGMARTKSGLGILLVTGYWGQYFMLDTDGLYVGALCKDSRTGPNLGPDVILMENFNGTLFRNKDNGKFYAFGGDTDARIWEVTGMDTLRKGTASVTLSAEDAMNSSSAVRTTKAIDRRTSLAIAKAPAGFKPDVLPAWDMAKAVSWDAGAGRTVKAALAYDANNLYAIWQVADTSPMANAGTDWLTLFKTGDTCDIMLAADQKAEASRIRPAAGDMRILFSVMEGKPMAVLYEAVARPGEVKEPHAFNSSTGSKQFERVVALTNAEVKVARSKDGYILSASVSLKDIGLAPSSGLKTKGDLGVLFSNEGGTVIAVRSYYFNKNSGITGDLPSEARLQPADWGAVEAE